MLFFILLLTFVTVTLIGYVVIPGLYSSAAVVSDKRQQILSHHMENLMSRKEAQKLSKIFIIAPFVLAGAFFLLFPEDFRLVGVLIGFAGGLILPGVYIRLLVKMTREKFNDQLVDALLIMSSSFRGGLSLIQALESVVEEMPDPINNEFGIVLGENKMGVSLEEALNHLYNRMPSTALQQMITAILLARETGGNLPVVFGRIVTNIRENKKIKQNLATLTIQGKIQGVVMSILPLAFASVLYSANRRIFENMFHSDMGRSLLLYCVISWAIGAFMIWKISTFEEV